MRRKLYSAPVFTAREIAALSGSTVAEAHRCASEGVVPGVKVRGERLFPRHLAYFLTVKSQLGGVTLSRRLSRKLYSEIAGIPDRELPRREITLTDAIRIHADSSLDRVVEDTCRYAEGRDRYITRDPDIKGGIPIIRGTRIDVYAVRQRLDSGESVEDLAAEHPQVPAQAFDAARLYAETHPRRGRPMVGRPAAA